VDGKIDVIVVPVSDVERSEKFYSEEVGFVVDVDQQVNENFRVVRMTPPGSACSVSIGTGTSPSPAGSLKGTQLVVTDVARAVQEKPDPS
jgi:catechol 2,3-dioxygenase-like lactoylglutathione lyase family enzyme